MTVRFKHPKSRKLTLMAAASVSSSLVLPLMWLEQWEMLSPAWHKYLSRLKIQWCHFRTKICIYIKPLFIASIKKRQLEKKTVFVLMKEKLCQLYRLTADTSKQILSPGLPPFPTCLYSVLAYEWLIVMMWICIFKASFSFKSPKLL